MLCRLCLTESDESIDIFCEDRISEYIVKFLQLELTPEDPLSKVICGSCWQELNNFQNFFIRVKEAQESLPTLQQELKRFSFVEYKSLESDTALKQSDAFAFFEILEINKEEITDQTLKTKNETNELLIPQRHAITINERARTASEDDIVIEEIKPKCSRPRKIKAEASKTNDGISIKAKEKRGRKPKERPNIEKVPSERTKKLLETSKKFDEIIKEHMTLYCDICNIDLNDFAELKLHFRRAHNLKGYAVCCNKRMHKRHLVVDHITSHDGTPYTCNVCGKNASSRDALRSHLKYVHLTKREFQCSFCDKAFKRALDLKEHTATHTGEVLYMCPHCPKTFTSRATMHGHRKEKHRTEWEANKRCSYF